MHNWPTQNSIYILTTMSHQKCNPNIPAPQTKVHIPFYINTLLPLVQYVYEFHDQNNPTVWCNFGKYSVIDRAKKHFNVSFVM